MIEKVHGLQATSITLNERFTMLAVLVPEERIVKPRRPMNLNRGSMYNQNLNTNNRSLINQIRRLELQARRQTLKQRLGFQNGSLRRYGSEGNLTNLRRSNSFGSLNQNNNVKNRVSWRQSNGNLSRSNSFTNLAGGVWRARMMQGFRRRGGGNRALRGRFRNVMRGGRVFQARITQGRAMRGRGQVINRGQANNRGQVNNRGQANNRGQPNRAQVARRGLMRKGISNRLQQTKPVPTKEELDNQLDLYMAGSKSALDKELEDYMKNAMEIEESLLKLK